jgi:hypothetical protein
LVVGLAVDAAVRAAKDEMSVVEGIFEEIEAFACRG